MSRKRKRSKKEGKKEKKQKKLPNSQLAAEVAEAVETNGSAIYDKLKPSVRRELTQAYGLWVGCHKKRWLVRKDPPPTIFDVVSAAVQDIETVIGDWTAKERSELKAHGMLVCRHEDKWQASWGCRQVNEKIGDLHELIKKSDDPENAWVKLDRNEELSKHVIKYHKRHGYTLTPFTRTVYRCYRPFAGYYLSLAKL